MRKPTTAKHVMLRHAIGARRGMRQDALVTKRGDEATRERKPEREFYYAKLEKQRAIMWKKAPTSLKMASIVGASFSSTSSALGDADSGWSGVRLPRVTTVASLLSRRRLGGRTCPGRWWYCPDGALRIQCTGWEWFFDCGWSF